MPDLLVRLYDLPPFEPSDAQTVVRPAMAYEKKPVVEWVQRNFSAGWAGECDVAFSRTPISCYIATRDGEIVGFACWDSTCRGFFGPLGVGEDFRRQGIGKVLLFSCLRAMDWAGYGYAVVGGVASAEYYEKAVGAIEIPGSSPGIYRDPLRRPAP